MNRVEYMFPSYHSMEPVYDRTSSKLNHTNNFLKSSNKEFAANVGHSKPTVCNFLAAICLSNPPLTRKS